ncbi:MAG TPA: 2-oxoacid:acceptor oxidoreductase family protein [bacterium]|nr:2-oxoacid:acceptor oxidoreductase family protein [bacterium]
MIEIRFHGRGGQGAVIGGKILATAVFSEGKFVQAFPSFGVERRGAPVTAFVRIDDARIDLRSQIYKPDHLIVLDPTLLSNPARFDGFKREGWVLINCKKSPEEVASHPKLSGLKVATVDASSIAVRNRLGSAMSPIVNTAILGAFCRVTGICAIDNVCSSIKKGVPVKAEANAKAAREAYEEVRFPVFEEAPPEGESVQEGESA